MSKRLLSGNEAVAQGAWEAGAEVGVGYPGTPSTQTLEHFATLPDVYAEWAPNEKVALEVAAGASLMGARTIVSTKHVGLNVMADPLFTLAYTGVNGGLVILVADDPGMHSSQNEQDSRNYAAFARVPMFEPSDSAEAREMAKEAFEVSERFDAPVLVRSVVRISHAKSLVEVGERVAPAAPGAYRKDVAKWVMMPAMAKARRLDLDRRIALLTEYAEQSRLNRCEYRDERVGVVCSGVAYMHVREALPEASTLKLGMVYPLPPAVIASFVERVDKLYVVEEADDYLARSIRAMGVEVETLDIAPYGELTPGAVAVAFGAEPLPTRERDDSLPPRPPLMCPGCPHRPVFRALGRMRALVSGDIGCYTLGTLKPLAAMDTCVCMGASIGMAHGAEVAAGEEKPAIVAVIGDSTFAHSGITGLLNTVYNGGAGTIAILDNRITAMTGHQGNPVDGITLQGRPGRELDLEKLCESLGVERVRVVDPQDVLGCEAVLREEAAAEELSVIIFRAPCALLLKERKDPYGVDEESCTKCGACIKLGCPAIGKDERTSYAYIDAAVCVGCGQCVQVCKYSAIQVSGPSCDFKGADR